MIPLITAALPLLLVLLREWFAWQERRRKAAERGDIEGYGEAISEGDTSAVEDALVELDFMHSM